MEKVGFTGTRQGMSHNQLMQLVQWFMAVAPEGGFEFHHGDCVGADEEAHSAALECGAEVHIHPPKVRRYRAFCKHGVVYREKDYLVRNRDIVDASDVVFAAPSTMVEKERSGTWSTVRYARKTGKTVILLER